MRTCSQSIINSSLKHFLTGSNCSFLAESVFLFLTLNMFLAASYIIFSPEEKLSSGDTLGKLLEERWDALSASALSLGTAVLTGPGHIPAFHWARRRRLRAVSLVTGWLRDAQGGRHWVWGGGGGGGCCRNIWRWETQILRDLLLSWKPNIGSLEFTWNQTFCVWHVLFAFQLKSSNKHCNQAPRWNMNIWCCSVL